jgi:hypothetical protein
LREGASPGGVGGGEIRGAGAHDRGAGQELQRGGVRRAFGFDEHGALIQDWYCPLFEPGGGEKQGWEAKAFFSEKKKQKTFANLHTRKLGHARSLIKVFLLLFLQKKKDLLTLPQPGG